MILHAYIQFSFHASKQFTILYNVGKLYKKHRDEKPKGKNSRVDGVATFGSLLRIETGDIPIKLTVKLYDANIPKLHVIINNRNRNTFVKEARFQFSESEATENVPDVVTVADFLRFVKDDAEFTKGGDRKSAQQTIHYII